MQFSQIVALAVAAVAVNAAPADNTGALIKRASCASGSTYCKESADKWASYPKQSENCPSGNVYCCISEAFLVNALNCVNILDGNNITVPVSILDNLTL